MDAGLLWTAGGTLAGCFALGLTSWQLRLQIRERRPGRTSGESEQRALPGPATVPVLAPVRSLPAEIRGRQEQLRELVGLAEKPVGRVVVLAGLGGIGKSTIAAALAERVQAGIRRHVWWVSAAEPGSLIAGMLAVARVLGASVAEQEAIASGTPQAPDALWAVLEREKHRWLLVIDNADAPQALAVPGAPAGSTSVADGTGWLRVPRTGLVVVTTRQVDAATWGRGVLMRRVERLGPADAGRILRDLAPHGGTEEEAASLGERLGGLPLALHLAGSYLGSDFALTRRFADYQRALDGSPQSMDLLTPDPDLSGDARSTVMYTWETSLDALARYGVPQARTLLRLLSCFGAATPIPDDLLQVGLLARLLPAEAATPTEQVIWLEQGMRGLIRLGLVSRLPVSSEDGDDRALILHPVVADVSRAHLAADRRAGRQVAGAIGSTAADLITEALAKLEQDRPSDWPAFRLLAPHFRALLNTTADSLGPRDLTRIARSAGTLTDYYEWSGPAALGEEVARAALAAVSRLPAGDQEVLGLRYWLGRSLSLQGRWQEADTGLRLLHAAQVEHLGAEARDTLRTEGELARIVADLGRYPEAGAALRSVLAAQERTLGARHPDTLDTYHALGRVAARRKRWDEAEAMFRTACDGRAAVFGIDHPATLASRNRLAWTVGQQGRRQEAEAELRTILGIRRALFGDEHHDTLATRERLGWVVALDGRLPEAEEELGAVVSARTRLLGADYLGTLNATVLLAQVIARRGRPAEARAMLDGVHQRQVRLFGADHPHTRETYELIGGLG
ncbi:ATP-binding protein [Kitasatospora sp. RG8]|uniref:tetratricopeptide repeat protein n=1 Tax=Kitasatospora sp. RG8 TaxID=2820815 RepID=UPI001AE0418B|nr:tetratricopeptide repeat protein [Kitasatospora sp. RG8]MBP0455189.1 ATP-binding protein [Kitasatospora sp. RG8]